MIMNCPDCGKPLTLVPKEDDPNIMLGFCTIKGKKRCVIMTPFVSEYPTLDIPTFEKRRKRSKVNDQSVTF